MQISITEWLDNTVLRYPDKAAIVDEYETITFDFYRKKALSLANKIITLGIGPQEPIVIYMEKCSKALISFLGVAYSRNFYSPIDIDMPAPRVDKILEILQPKVVITTGDLKSRFEKYAFDGEYIIYEDVMPSEQDEKMVQSVSATILDMDLIYVLFTSGSTGIPKGVSIRHRSLINYIDWVVEEFCVESDDAFGNQAPFYFDISALDIYSTLKTGATLYIIPRNLFSKPVELLQYLKTNHVNSIFWVPTELIMVARMKALKKLDMSDTMKRVLFCGEVMPNKELNFWRKYLPDAIYANLYGPTEATIACTFYLVNREFSNEEPLPIGKPIRNTESLVLDDNERLITPDEIGTLGELCLKGICLAVGYYKNPQKTREVFIQNPINDRYDEVIYRTGDLVSYNEYGELMYNGRKDFQVKHLGYRIELGEIETAVSSFDDITRNCCVYDKKHARIVLFIVAKTEISREDVRKRLLGMIPEYMIPEKVVQLDSMPINDNGKIDRNKLKERL